MKLAKRLLRRPRPRIFPNIRGLSTAELVGIIVVVGCLGALGGTFVKGLVSQTDINVGNENATNLNSTVATAFYAGATVGSGAGQIDTSSAAAAITALNNGVTVNGVLYKMESPIASGSIGSY